LNPKTRRPLSAYLENYIYYPFYVGGIYVLSAVLGPYLSRLIVVGNGGPLPRIVASNRSTAVEIGMTLAFVVTWDVWQYWVHRWQHTSPILWATHKLHHSDPELNSSSQSRHHFLSYALNLACYAPMLLLFGALTPHAVAGFLMFKLWGFVNHANLRISFGPLTGIIAGPQWHRIHHSMRMEHLDKNFATFFPFIDRVFGTYYEPAENEYPPTGLVGGETERFVRQATISPFIAWYSAFRHLTRP
jgi:sterol desaturase/sphingolipid hydroxylase (fatty acid hydroxylase superfamily)